MKRSRVSARIACLEAILLLLLMVSAAAAPLDVVPLAPVLQTDGRTGTCYTFYPPHGGSGRPYLPMAYDAGARWDRFDFTWPAIEPSNDAWNFGGHDTLVADLRAAGIDNIVGIPLWTPDWASTLRVGAPGAAQPSFDERPAGWYAPLAGPHVQALAPHAAASPPQGLYLPWNDPHNHWGNYIYTIVSHFGDRVKYWEMWNEAEWDFFWVGSDADYAQLLKVGYQATKAACPDCRVLFAGLHYWDDPTFYERVLDILNDDPDAASNNYFFDVMSVHLYSRSSSLYDTVQHIRSRMGLYVPSHPIWITETGVPVWDDATVDPYPFRYDYAATQEEAADYLIQSYANAWAAGVERYFFFRTNDEDMGEYFGLIRNDRSLRPAYVAYQVAAGTLVSPTFVTRVPGGDSVRVTLWGTPQGKVSVLWSTGSGVTTYTLPAAMNTATRLDRRGVTQTITATGGVYTLTLPGATAFNTTSQGTADYYIGGEPTIVIESESANLPPSSFVHPLPALTYTPTFTVSWEGQDNEAGVWFYDLQVRDSSTGTWVTLQDNITATSAAFTGTNGRRYEFRSRAYDRLGYIEDWPASPDASTTMVLTGTLHVDLGSFFGDDDRSGTREDGEPLLDQVALRLRDAAGRDVVSPTVAAAWNVTVTMTAGESYVLWAESGDYLRGTPLSIPHGGASATFTRTEYGLWPAQHTYLPLVLRLYSSGN